MLKLCHHLPSWMTWPGLSPLTSFRALLIFSLPRCKLGSQAACSGKDLHYYKNSAEQQYVIQKSFQLPSYLCLCCCQNHWQLKEEVIFLLYPVISIFLSHCCVVFFFSWGNSRFYIGFLGFLYPFHFWFRSLHEPHDKSMLSLALRRQTCLSVYQRTQIAVHSEQFSCKISVPCVCICLCPVLPLEDRAYVLGKCVLMVRVGGAVTKANRTQQMSSHGAFALFALSS